MGILDPRLTAEMTLIGIGKAARPLLEQSSDYDRRWWAINDDTPEETTEAISEEGAVLSDLLWELKIKATGLRALSLDGMRAKAMLIRHQIKVQSVTHGKLDKLDITEALAWSLCDDLLGPEDEPHPQFETGP